MDTYRTFCSLPSQFVDLDWIATLFSITGSSITVARIPLVLTFHVDVTISPAGTHTFLIASVLCKIGAWIRTYGGSGGGWRGGGEIGAVLTTGGDRRARRAGWVWNYDLWTDTATFVLASRAY